jgi:hypothetical protein
MGKAPEPDRNPSVSGGSIAAGVLAPPWKDLQSTTAGGRPTWASSPGLFPMTFLLDNVRTKHF